MVSNNIVRSRFGSACLSLSFDDNKWVCLYENFWYSNVCYCWVLNKQVLLLMDGVAKTLEENWFRFYATQVLLNSSKTLQKALKCEPWYLSKRKKIWRQKLLLISKCWRLKLLKTACSKEIIRRSEDRSCHLSLDVEDSCF